MYLQSTDSSTVSRAFTCALSRSGSIRRITSCLIDSFIIVDSPSVNYSRERHQRQFYWMLLPPLIGGINKNLEEQGLALYKSYFIDYSPYGNIQPEGWTSVTLEDVCLKITDGSHYSPKDDPHAPYPMYSVKDMENFGFNSSSCKHISADEFEAMKERDCVPLLNDILVAKDGSYLKEIFICSEQKDEAILSSIAIFRPNPDVILPDILLFLLKQPSIRTDVADNYVSGSALPRIVLKDFKRYQFTLPPIDEQRKIEGLLHSFRMQIAINVKENKKLIALRDILLQKLMSGELDISSIDL